jgi:maltose alpha-D-glucosyltransferase/alpha-amylase
MAASWGAPRAGAAAVTGYLEAIQGTSFLPSRVDTELPLDAHLLERAYYELAFELNHRARWVRAPLLDIPMSLS